MSLDGLAVVCCGLVVVALRLLLLRRLGMAAGCDVTEFSWLLAGLGVVLSVALLVLTRGRLMRDLVVALLGLEGG